MHGGGGSAGSRLVKNLWNKIPGSNECKEAVLGTALSAAEDFATLSGAGLAVKGLRGLAALRGFAEVAVAERLGVNEEVLTVFARRGAMHGIPLVALNNASSLSRAATTAAVLDDSFTLKGFLLDLTPVVGTIRQGIKAYRACRAGD